MVSLGSVSFNASNLAESAPDCYSAVLGFKAARSTKSAPTQLTPATPAEEQNQEDQVSIIDYRFN